MIDLKLLHELHKKCAGRVKYKLGAKVPLTTDSADIKRIDCSGYSRWILARASNQALRMPDGSQVQLDWVRDQGWRKLAKYADVEYAKNDGSRLFIAFLSPKPGNSWPRHVWLVRYAMTMESCGSRGVTSRPWDNVNLRGCKDCFEIPV